MNEKISQSKNFEQKLHREIEQKFIPLFPENLANLREQARPVEQFYLSIPDEPYSLRMREELTETGDFVYTAALKDRGSLTPDGIDRLEIEVPISYETYLYYQPHMPSIRKLRTHVYGVDVDFYDDDSIQIESENPEAWQRFTEQYGNDYIDMTGDMSVDNESRAYAAYRAECDNPYMYALPPELKARDIAYRVIQRAQSDDQSIFVRVLGRSGSGKSTIVRELRDLLDVQDISSTTISTDDYHRGASWLREYNDGKEWTRWDAPIVYDTKTMANDLKQLSVGTSIPRRTIDFTDCEPQYNGTIAPTRVVIIEGIYAGSCEFDNLDSLDYQLQTPLATCIGRRLMRDMHERPEFADPEKSLKYMLEQAEPAWRRQTVG